MDTENQDAGHADINIDELFSSYFPLPFRVVSTLILGVWAWAIILYCFHTVRIDVEALLRFNMQKSGPPLYKSVVQVATVLTFVYSVSGLLFWTAARTKLSVFVLGLDLFPIISFVAIPVVFFYPGFAFRQSGRYRFLKTLRRILVGGLDRESRFADIITADALTSYAKVLGDMWVMTCMISSRKSISDIPERTCGGKLMVPFIISIPYAIRLRQCLTDFIRSGGRERSHLLNAAKYMTTFPVIFMSVIQRSPHFGTIGLYQLWVLSMIVNSMYSFYWDVAMDWDLTMFDTSSKYENLPHKGLRSVLYFSPAFYYVSIIVDFVLRFTWSLKLSPHLYFLNDLEGGVFLLEIMELIRRCFWLVLRIEAEWIRSTSTGRLPVTTGDEAKD